jgi:hypothetical protein
MNLPALKGGVLNPTANKFNQMLVHIMHNVPAAYDGLGCTIKKLTGFRAAQMWMREVWEWNAAE